MKKIIVLLSMISSVFAGETLRGELASKKVVNGLGSVDIKVINTEDDSFVVDFAQTHKFEDCKYGEFDIEPKATVEEQGYTTYSINWMRCYYR